MYNLPKKTIKTIAVMITLLLILVAVTFSGTAAVEPPPVLEEMTLISHEPQEMTNVEYFAVIITGGATYAPQQDLAIRQCEEAYNVLKNTWRYTDNNIYYINPDPNYDPTDYEVDNVSSPETIEYSITVWLASRLDSNDVGFIYMIDHGQPGGHFNIDENGDGYLNFSTEYIKNVQMQMWLNEIPQYGKLITVIECCYSGWFEYHISGSNRIGITSSDEYHKSYIDSNGWSVFSHAFFQSLGNGHSVEHAFNIGRSNALHQNPLMNDQCFGETYLGNFPHLPYKALY